MGPTADRAASRNVRKAFERSGDRGSTQADRGAHQGARGVQHLSGMRAVVVCRRAVADGHMEPDASSEIVTQARLGDTGVVAAESPGWIQVRFDHDEYTGWVAADAVVDGPWPPPGGELFRARNLFVHVH